MIFQSVSVCVVYIAQKVVGPGVDLLVSIAGQVQGLCLACVFDVVTQGLVTLG